MSARFGFTSAAPRPLVRKLRSTAIKTWHLCRRKWWFDVVAGMKQPDRYHFVVGTALHSVAERYISRQAKRWEDLFPAGWDAKLAEEDRAWARQVAEEAVAKGIWQARPDLRVEYPIAYLVGREFRDRRGMPLMARTHAVDDGTGERTQAIPTALLDGSPLPAGWDRLPIYASFIDVLDLQTPVIYDHKTAKARRYALTSEKLAKDPQVLCYAVTPFALRADVERVGLQHNVFLKGDNPDVYPVKAEATLESVNACWDDVIQSSEDMALLREVAPRIDVQGHPEERAGNWRKVSGAIEAGNAKEACNAYGGCHYRDLCFGRCTHQQLTRRLDAPDVRKLLEQQGISPATRKFGLASTRPPRTGPIEAASTSTTVAKEISMPFAQAAVPAPLTVNSDAYVCDPDTDTVQYRCRVKAIDGAQATIWIYPSVKIAPKFATLSELYQAVVPLAALSAKPHPTAIMTDYAESLRKHGVQSPQWEADEPQAQVAAQAAAPTPATDTRPPRDGRFGLAGAAAPARAPEAPPAQVEQVPEPTFQPRVGQVVLVLPTEHPFWKQYAGKMGKITNIAGDGLLALEIDGLPFDGVDAGRLSLPAQPVCVSDLVGQIVSVRLYGNPTPFNGLLEAQDATGITMMGGKLKATWEQVEHIGPLTYGDIPGAPPPKQPRAKKGASPEGTASPSPASSTPASEPAASTSATSAAPGTEGAGQQQIAIDIGPSTALDRALAAVTAVLSGSGKVTRKAFEAIHPLLVEAQQHQLVLGALQKTGQPAATGYPPLFSKGELRAKLQQVRQEMEALAQMVGIAD